jgi:hypothetical protein
MRCDEPHIALPDRFAIATHATALIASQYCLLRPTKNASLNVRYRTEHRDGKWDSAAVV